MRNPIVQLMYNKSTLVKYKKGRACIINKGLTDSMKANSLYSDYRDRNSFANAWDAFIVTLSIETGIYRLLDWIEARVSK